MLCSSPRLKCHQKRNPKEKTTGRAAGTPQLHLSVMTVSLGATVTEGEQEVSQSPATETFLMTAPPHCSLGDLCPV